MSENYYMEECVLLGTKPLVDSIRHFIRDPSGVFSVFHLCECRIVQWRHDSRLLLLLNWFLASRLFSLHMIKRTLHVSSKIWILCSRGKNNISRVSEANEIFLAYGWAHSTIGSQNFGVLTKRYDNSLFFAANKNENSAQVPLASTSS